MEGLAVAGVFTVRRVDTLHIVRGDPDVPHSKPAWRLDSEESGTVELILIGNK